MSPFLRTTWLAVALGAVAALGTTALYPGNLYAADDDDDAGPSPEQVRMATQALDRAVARGNELFRSKDLGKKSCASCHENPDKPNQNLRTRDFSYPAYSRRRKAVVSLDQKINEMIKFNGRGAPLDPESPDMAALAAYVTSLEK